MKIFIFLKNAVLATPSWIGGRSFVKRWFQFVILTSQWWLYSDYLMILDAPWVVVLKRCILSRSAITWNWKREWDRYETEMVHYSIFGLDLYLQRFGLVKLRIQEMHILWRIARLGEWERHAGQIVDDTSHISLFSLDQEIILIFLCS